MYIFLFNFYLNISINFSIWTGSREKCQFIGMRRNATNIKLRCKFYITYVYHLIICVNK